MSQSKAQKRHDRIMSSIASRIGDLRTTSTKVIAYNRAHLSGPDGQIRLFDAHGNFLLQWIPYTGPVSGRCNRTMFGSQCTRSFDPRDRSQVKRCSLCHKQYNVRK